MPDPDELKKRQQRLRVQRTRFMGALWDLTDGSDHKLVHTGQVATEAGIPLDEAAQLVRDLKDRDLLEASGGLATADVLRITRRGVDQVLSLADPNHETPDLARNVVTISGSGHSVVLQQGTESSHQQATISHEQRTQLAQFAESVERALKEAPLDEPRQSHARAALSTVQDQLALPDPERALLDPGLAVLKQIAIGVATSGAWEAVKELASHL